MSSYHNLVSNEPKLRCEFCLKSIPEEKVTCITCGAHYHSSCVLKISNVRVVGRRNLVECCSINNLNVANDKKDDKDKDVQIKVSLWFKLSAPNIPTVKPQNRSRRKSFFERVSRMICQYRKKQNNVKESTKQILQHEDKCSETNFKKPEDSDEAVQILISYDNIPELEQDEAMLSCIVQNEISKQTVMEDGEASISTFTQTEELFNKTRNAHFEKNIELHTVDLNSTFSKPSTSIKRKISFWASLVQQNTVQIENSKMSKNNEINSISKTKPKSIYVNGGTISTQTEHEISYSNTDLIRIIIDLVHNEIKNWMQTQTEPQHVYEVPKLMNENQYNINENKTFIKSMLSKMKFDIIKQEISKTEANYTETKTKCLHLQSEIDKLYNTTEKRDKINLVSYIKELIKKEINFSVNNKPVRNNAINNFDTKDMMVKNETETKLTSKNFTNNADKIFKQNSIRTDKINSLIDSEAENKSEMQVFKENNMD